MQGRPEGRSQRTCATGGQTMIFIASEFHTFDNQHLITLAAIAAISAIVVWAARKSGVLGRAWIGRLLAFLLLAYSVGFYLEEAIRHELTWQYSLPLELCDLVLIACIVSLLWPNRLTAEIAYFWGLGGVLQASITPDITQGFPSWQYFLFFFNHGVTLISIAFLISDRRFRAQKRSILRMMIALNVYGLVVGAVDAVTGWNYGYLRQKPGMPSLIDFMGPWPWYLVSLEVTGLIVFLLLYLPWHFLFPVSGSRFRAKNVPTGNGERETLNQE
jgi:hypothetical integral membrane protein (TIGR02206 family)